MKVTHTKFIMLMDVIFDMMDKGFIKEEELEHIYHHLFVLSNKHIHEYGYSGKLDED